MAQTVAERKEEGTGKKCLSITVPLNVGKVVIYCLICSVRTSIQIINIKLEKRGEI